MMERWDKSHGCWQRDPGPNPLPACVGSGSWSYHSLFLGHHYHLSRFLVFHHYHPSPAQELSRYGAETSRFSPRSGKEVVTCRNSWFMMCNTTCSPSSSVPSFHLGPPRKELRIPQCSQSHPLKRVTEGGGSHLALPLCVTPSLHVPYRFPLSSPPVWTLGLILTACSVPICRSSGEALGRAVAMAAVKCFLRDYKYRLHWGDSGAPSSWVGFKQVPVLGNEAL